MLEFFLRAAEAVDLPFCLYNFPELTGNRIGLETIAAFAERAPMAAIKQSGAEFAYHRPLIRLGHEKGFTVFSGADARLPEVFSPRRRRLYWRLGQYRAGFDGEHLQRS